jgi:hypothetical protein
MVVQPPQARVCLSCQSPEASSRTAQLAVEIARLNAALRQLQQIGLATGLLAHRFAIIPERGWTGAEDRLWPVIRGLTC